MIARRVVALDGNVAYVPREYQSRTTIITPSIDAFCPKNQEIDDDIERHG